VIEFARNVCDLKGANSSEFASHSPHPVVHLMSEQEKVANKGGTMRLGVYPCRLLPGTKVRQAYGVDEIGERHRHRYEINNEYRDKLEAEGLKISGVSPDGSLVEIIEISAHPWFVGCQFHPELKSRPNRPHPLFLGLVDAALNVKK